MGYSFYLLTAAVLAGSPTTSSTEFTGSAQPAQVTSPADTTPSSSPSFGQRLRNLFHRHADTTEPAPAPTPSVRQPAPVTQPTKLTAHPAAATVTSSEGGPAPAPSPYPPLSQKEMERVGHEQDYSWITGKLIHAPGVSGWVLHYAGQYEVDQYGGAVVLSGSPELAKFHEGDLVCVRGQVVSGGTGLRGHGTAQYQVKDVHLIEHTGIEHAGP